MASKSNALLVVGIVIVLALVTYGYVRVLELEQRIETPVEALSPVSAPMPRLAKLVGTVEMRYGGEWRPAVEGRVLSPGHVVRAGTGEALLLDEAGLSAQVAAGAQVAVDRADSELLRLIVEAGTLTVDQVAVGRDGRAFQVGVGGSDALVESRAGRISVTLGEGGGVRVAVQRGTAIVEANGVALELRAGQASVVDSGGGPRRVHED